MARKISLTPVQIEAKRNELSKLNKEQLNKMSRDRLREACSGCLDTKNTDKKEVLVNKILEWTEPLRLEQLAAFKIVAEQLGESSLNMDEVGRVIQIASPEVAANLIQEMMLLRKYTVTTRVKTYQPRLVKHVKANQTPEYAAEFAKVLYSLNREENIQIKREYEKELDVKAIDKEIIYYKEVIDWATKTLVEKNNWKHVSIALSITSGRRMIEIHNCGEFTIGEKPAFLPNFEHVKGWLSFEGQAKEKGKTPVGRYDIPCLVDVDLWLSAYQYLVDNQKTGKDENGVPIISREKVNKNYSVELSKTIKMTVYTKGIIMYKHARDFYAAVMRGDLSLAISKQDMKAIRLTEDILLQKVLGHGLVKEQHSYTKIGIVFG
jgi:hypothetical protein